MMTELPGPASQTRRSWMLVRMLTLACAVCVLFIGARSVMAQATDPAAAVSAPAATVTANAPEAQKVPLMKLISQAFDLFMVLLVAGSLAGWTIIIICFIEVREKVIAPAEPQQIMSGLIRSARWSELRQFVADDDAMTSRIVRAAVNCPSDDKGGMREAAEMAASEECSRWFRRIEPLNVIGNLGPLLGLAGTVWGMILAFLALGEAGGQANPTNLSLGISKALMHTLLGLLLAVPCLTVFGLYRSKVDRLCTRAMVAASELIEMLPEDARLRLGAGAGMNGAPLPPPARNAPPAAPSAGAGMGVGAPTPRPATPRGTN